MIPTYLPIGRITELTTDPQPVSILISPDYTITLPSALAHVWADPDLKGQPAATWAQAIHQADPDGQHPFDQWIAHGLLAPWPWNIMADQTLINEKSLGLWHDPNPYDADHPSAAPIIALDVLQTHIQHQNGERPQQARDRLIATIPNVLRRPGWYLMLNTSLDQAARRLRKEKL